MSNQINTEWGIVYLKGSEDICITEGLSHIKEEKERNFSKLKDARDMTTKYNNRSEAEFYIRGKFSLKGEKYCKRF